MSGTRLAGTAAIQYMQICTGDNPGGCGGGRRMVQNDASFVGSIPELYDENVGPTFMLPYASDIASRLSHLQTGRLLEVAAGTGIVTAALSAALPRVEITGTDLNQPMIDFASTKAELRRVNFRQADALDLPFDDGRFDAVVCQFGVM